MQRSALLISLGQVEYDRALVLQRAVVGLRQQDEVPDTLILLEHPPVLTLGRSAKMQNILVSEPDLRRRGIVVRRVERGGDVTYHGPGQLVGYPIFRLESELVSVRRFVAGVEEAIIHALQELGVKARVNPGYIGVWVSDRKIASIGIAVNRRVTFHGFALNIATDLGAFRLINPCGIAGVQMTSVRAERGYVDEAEARDAIVAGFETVFGLRFQTQLPRNVTVLTNGLSASAIASASARE